MVIVPAAVVFLLCGTAAASDGDDVTSDRFGDMIACVLFMVCVWLVGKISARLGCPSLVGEIIVGVVAGPPVLDIVPFPRAFQSAGDVGLLLLVLEAGLMVDVEMLEVVGPRGLKVGLFGSVAPMVIAFVVATAWGADMKEAIATSGAMVTMSTGITLNVLKGCGALNQPLGQLVIAAATVNEVFSIVVLTLVTNMANGATVAWYAIPLATTLVLFFSIGYAAVWIVPKILDERILPSIPENQRHNALLGMIFATGLVLAPSCRLAGSSELLGAFLAGLTFCSDRAAHDIWDKQVKRVLHWLLRLFFAASIGFSIPSPANLSGPLVLAKAGLLELAVFGKLAVGFFDDVPECFSRPLGFAWAEFGEVSLVIATAARKVLADTTYDGIVLAVLASVVVFPYALRKTLTWKESKTLKMVDDSALFYCVQTRSRAAWDLTAHLAHSITDLDCEIIDFRSFHPTYCVGEPHCLNEIYCKDLTSVGNVLDEKRIQQLAQAIQRALGSDEDCDIKIHHWLPNKVPSHHPRHSEMRRFLEDETLTDTFRVEPNHELEGYIHTCCDDDDEEHARLEPTSMTRLYSSEGRELELTSMNRLFSSCDNILSCEDEDDEEDDDDQKDATA